MKHFKRMLPFFFTILLLSMSISIPILLFEIQDKALLHGVKTEPVSTKAEIDAKQIDISILDRLELMQEQNSNYVIVSRLRIKQIFEGGGVNQIKQVLKELEKLQQRNAFPDFKLKEALNYNNDLFQKLIFLSDQNWEVPVFIMTFTTKSVSFTVWVDADTNTIYQYRVNFREMPDSMDKKTVAKAFSDYLSISEGEFWTHYSFTNDGAIELQLK